MVAAPRDRGRDAVRPRRRRVRSAARRQAARLRKMVDETRIWRDRVGGRRLPWSESSHHHSTWRSSAARDFAIDLEAGGTDSIEKKIKKHASSIKRLGGHGARSGRRAAQAGRGVHGDHGCSASVCAPPCANGPFLRGEHASVVTHERRRAAGEASTGHICLPAWCVGGRLQRHGRCTLAPRPSTRPRRLATRAFSWYMHRRRPRDRGSGMAGAAGPGARTLRGVSFVTQKWPRRDTETRRLAVVLSTTIFGLLLLHLVRQRRRTQESAVACLAARPPTPTATTRSLRPDLVRHAAVRDGDTREGGAAGRVGGAWPQGAAAAAHGARDVDGMRSGGGL